MLDERSSRPHHQTCFQIQAGDEVSIIILHARTSYYLSTFNFVLERWDRESKTRIVDENSTAYHVEAYDPKTNEVPAEIKFGVARITHASAGFSGDFQPGKVISRVLFFGASFERCLL